MRKSPQSFGRPCERSSSRRQGEHAFNLVVLVMAITVMNIMIAMALPVTSQQIRRDKEEELIFRGLQYSEALRRFQLDNQRQPVRFEELVEDFGKPRAIRRLWPNPMTEDGSWALLLVAGPGPPGQDLAPSGTGDINDQAGFGSDGGAPTVPIGKVPKRGEESFDGFGGNDIENVQGPIRGVYSLEGGEAVKSFFGSFEISEWQFTADLVAPQGGGAGVSPDGQPAGAPPGGQRPPLGWMIGRPFPIAPPTGLPGTTTGLQPPGNPTPPSGSPDIKTEE